MIRGEQRLQRGDGGRRRTGEQEPQWGLPSTTGRYSAIPAHSTSARAAVAADRASASSRSTNSTPSRWSVSCWMARASSSEPSIRTASPCMFQPVATTCRWRRQSQRKPGIDRQPSGASSVSSPTAVTSGLTRWPTEPSTYQVKTRRPTPSCGAASPAPPAANMVSVRSATRPRSSASKSTTGVAGVRSTGSPNSRIGVTLTRRSYAAPRSRQGGSHRGLHVQGGRREDRDIDVVRTEEQFDLRAAQDPPFGTARDEPVHDRPVGLPGLLADDPDTQLLVDDPVHLG